MKKLLLITAILLICTYGVNSQTAVYSAVDTNISVKVGEHFDIRLASNQSTGYSWHVENNFGSIVFIKGKDYISPQDGKLGSGGDEVWHFEALAQGEARLIFFYSRSLERSEGDNILNFTITIK